MKKATQKKPKVFRTLIRLIHMGGKPVQENGNGQNAGKNKNEKGEGRPFFFGR